jgi:hypothetical protein
VSDYELSVLRVVVITEDHIDYFNNHACLICSVVNVVDWDLISEGVCGCKGTSVCFLTSPTLTLNPPCSYIYS